MTWTFMISDIDANVIGEVTDAHERHIHIPLNGVPEAAFVVRGDHPLISHIRNEDLLLKVYDDNKVLRFHGPVIKLEEKGDSGYTARLTAVGPAWCLNRPVRHIVRTNQGVLFDPAFAGVLDPAVPVNLALQNYHVFIKRCGIDIGSPSTASDIRGYYLGPFENPMDVLVELGESLNGFDWYIDPVEPFNNASSDQIIGALVLDDVIGTTKPNAIFEWGTGQRNVKSWERVKDWSTVANRIYVTDGTVDVTQSSGAVEVSDATSIAYRGEWFDHVIAAGINAPELLQKTAEAHLETRKNPRELYKFDPQPALVTAPIFGVDFGLGDFITFRAKYNDTVLFNGQVRVWAVDITIDDNGQTIISPVIEPS